MQVSKSFTQSVKDFMNKDAPKLDIDSTLRDAIEIFRKNKIMILPVMDRNNRFTGIMTPSALFNALSEDAAIDEKILPFIIQNAVTLNVDDDLAKARLFLSKKQVGQAVVLSEDQHFCGVLDTKNIIQAYQNKSENLRNALEVTKKLERTLQTVLDTTYDGLIVIDQKGKIEMINDAACELVLTHKEKIVNQPVSKLIPEIKLEEVLTQDSHGEKLEAMVIGKQRCLVMKIPIYREKQLVGAIAKIIYKNLTKWKSVVSRLNDLEKELSYYRGELSLIGGTPFDLDDIITRNEEMARIKEFARQIAPGFSNVLLLGESGTGKELFARGIHAASNRTGSFIKVNCAAIPEDLWESEFFGYADGAFTGAIRGGKQGKFELANNGTIFLDEIGDMPLSMQVKLLRVLQEREFERVGGTKTIRVNVRILAATNKNLEEMVALKRFREDLFYRLNVIVIHIPSLREHNEDIPLLASSITKKFSHLLGLGQVNISKTALRLLTSYHWPGNVRELENIIERAMNCINSDILDVEHLPEFIQKPREIQNFPSTFLQEPPKQTNSFEVLTSEHYKNTKNMVEKDAIETALRQTEGNRTAAAKLLGISRSQFYKKLQKFEMVDK